MKKLFQEGCRSSGSNPVVTVTESRAAGLMFELNYESSQRQRDEKKRPGTFYENLFVYFDDNTQQMREEQENETASAEEANRTGQVNEMKRWLLSWKHPNRFSQ